MMGTFSDFMGRIFRNVLIAPGPSGVALSTAGPRRAGFAHATPAAAPADVAAVLNKLELTANGDIVPPELLAR